MSNAVPGLSKLVLAYHTGLTELGLLSATNNINNLGNHSYSEVETMADKDRTIQILDPTAEDVPEELGLSPNLPDLGGKMVGLLENRKHQADEFMQELQDVLLSNYGAKKVVYATKFSYSAPCAEETLDSLSAECDVVVHGIAD